MLPFGVAATTPAAPSHDPSTRQRFGDGREHLSAVVLVVTHDRSLPVDVGIPAVVGPRALFLPIRGIGVIRRGFSGHLVDYRRLNGLGKTGRFADFAALFDSVGDRNVFVDRFLGCQVRSHGSKIPCAASGNAVGACATDYSSAKISLLQGTHRGKIIARHGVEKAKGLHHVAGTVVFALSQPAGCESGEMVACSSKESSCRKLWPIPPAQCWTWSRSAGKQAPAPSSTSETCWVPT